jgi:phosphatidylglycerol lysyltransferase
VVLLVLAAGLALSFRRNRADTYTGDHAHARSLLTANGGSSFSYMTVWPGNSYWFTPDGRGYVAYRVVGTVAVTTGDPIGPPDAHRDAVTGFAGFCADRGLTACLYAVTTPTRDSAEHDLHWRSIQVAQETIVPLTGLTFTGKKWQDIRSSVNRAAKNDITAQWISYRHAPLPITEQIAAISEEWVADKGLPEMGFTLGGLDELADDRVRCLIAVDRSGTVHAVTSWLPVYRDGEPVAWTLDFMRRRPGSVPGVIEFLVARAAQDLKDRGADYLSLSGAPLARVDRDAAPDPLQRFLDLLSRTLEPVYGFRSLLDFKTKFQPEYHPRWMAYPDPVALPSIANAITRCYLPRLSARQVAGLVRKLRN